VRCALSRGWGAKSAAAVLRRFAHLEAVPKDWREWHVDALHAAGLARTLSNEYDRALLFRTLATLRTDIALFRDVDDLEWRGPAPDFDALGALLDAAVTAKANTRASRS